MRATLAAAAVAVLAGFAVSLPPRADRLSAVVAALGIAAVGLLVLALLGRWSGLLPWALALAGAEYACFLLLRGKVIDAYAPVYAGGLLLCTELAFWSMERHLPGDRPGLGRRRATLVGAGCLVAGGFGAMILSASELAIRGGLLLEVLGVAAAVGAFALLARLARE
jgi:hypothetical protein